MNKTTRISEKDLVKKAMESVLTEKEKERSEFIAGEALSEDFRNPPLGDRQHRCLDPEGRYQPTWTCLNIHRSSEDFPSRQHFCLGSKVWKVATGEWVDVPPGIMSILDNTIMSEIEMDLTKANPLAEKGVEKIIRRIPRFAMSTMPSA